MTSQSKIPLSQHLLEPLLAVVLFTAMLPTIVVYRAAIQPDYTWGLFSFSGTGVVEAYWGVVAVAVFCWIVLFLGLARPRFPFHLSLLLWAILLFGTLLYGMVRRDAELRGDAWGIELGVGWGVLLVAAAVLIATIFWAIADMRSSRIHPATLISRERVTIALALAPFIGLLFFLGDGEIHTVFDRIAIGLVVVQGIVAATAFRASSEKQRELDAA